MKKTIITVFACLVLFGFTVTGAFAQTWMWDGPYDITTSPKYIEIAANPNDDAYLLGLIEGGGIGQIPTTGTAVERIPATNIVPGPVVDLIVGHGGVVYVIDNDTVGTWDGSVFVPFVELDQPYVPTGSDFLDGEGYKSLAAGKNGKLYVLFETADKQYLLVGNPPFTVINATVRFTPRSLNLGSKGNWVSCSIGGLPEEGYTVDWANPEAVCITAINDDTEVVGLPICHEDGPVNAGTKLKVKFSRQDLATVITNAGSPSSVSLTVTGYVSAGEEDLEFTGTDTFKTKAKKVK